MAGIYIHIPFCKQACNYCNFHFSTSLKLKNDFLEALLKEIAVRQNYIGDEIVETIYFGGGTPSILSPAELSQIFSALSKHFNISASAEITLEANPDDIHPEKLASWKTQGINRLSIGVQSFYEEDLKWMNRAHSAQQAGDCILLAQAAGITNMSIDLIYGGPTLSDEKWLNNMQQAVALNIPHLSCYALTVEPGTALDVLTRRKKTANVSSDDQARQFMLMTAFLQEKGYEHYEISNLALPGKRSRHNSSYWKGEKYLGLGPSAHSFNGSARQWNIANNALYIEGMRNDRPVYEIEELTEQQQFNEYIMTSLRTIEGTDLNHIEKKFGESFVTLTVRAVEDYRNKGWVDVKGSMIRLTNEGKLFADGIASDLFIV